MDHSTYRRLFRISSFEANRGPFLAVVCLSMALACACASNRGTAGVGQPITIVPSATAGLPSAPGDLARTGLVVITWNLHEGRGDIARLLASERPADVVMMLQEATRRTLPRIVEPLGLFASYVPSMPNGSSGNDDRGCAIVSTLPIRNTTAIELPWIYQRRVVVVSTVDGVMDGAPTAIRFACVHLDNRPGRRRQAEWLAGQLKGLAADGSPLVVGGDLNTWFGAGEATVRAIDTVVPRVRECGDRPTFRFGRHLDYLFTTVPREARGPCEVSADRFGSDHHPVVLRLLG
jgi:endonuclease/exonuclease/phosphatase family metal-dependent hydrolase